ncbi:ribulose-phosphate 3-epimerase [Candidatus Levyibacteriota bacterium]|nr:hypothetical protein [Candidatus Levybacteria bacterium]MSU26278.1 hypothetical protein [Candidatus Levybacteria bacterium]GDX62216.1 ribulose-phosphate 3-epimerase [Candidatus Levybacteria bacterium]
MEILEIIPGILEKDWDEIEKKIELIRPFAKKIHIDIIDGKFSPNETFLDPAPFKKYTNEIFFELHMMVEEPINYLDSFAKVGFQRFIGHIEHMSDQVEFITKAQFLGEAGLYVDGPSELADILVPLEDLDCIGIFTANKAGFSGQPFEDEMLEKIKLIEKQFSWMKIEADGGINEKTIIQSRDAGATRFVATSFLFNNGNNPHEQYDILQKILKTTVEV